MVLTLFRSLRMQYVVSSTLRLNDVLGTWENYFNNCLLFFKQMCFEITLVSLTCSFIAFSFKKYFCFFKDIENKWMLVFSFQLKTVCSFLLKTNLNMFFLLQKDFKIYTVFVFNFNSICKKICLYWKNILFSKVESKLKLNMGIEIKCNQNSFSN